QSAPASQSHTRRRRAGSERAPSASSGERRHDATRKSPERKLGRAAARRDPIKAPDAFAGARISGLFWPAKPPRPTTPPADERSRRDPAMDAMAFIATAAAPDGVFGRLGDAEAWLT